MAPGSTRSGQGASGRTWSRAEGNPPTSSVSPGRTDFDSINDSSSSRSSDDSRTRSDSSNSNDSGDLPTLVERSARGLEVAWPTPRHAKRTQGALVTGLDHERVVRGCPAGVCNEDRGNQEDHGRREDRGRGSHGV